MRAVPHACAGGRPARHMLAARSVVRPTSMARVRLMVVARGASDSLAAPSRAGGGGGWEEVVVVVGRGEGWGYYYGNGQRAGSLVAGPRQSLSPATTVAMRCVAVFATAMSGLDIHAYIL